MAVVELIFDVKAPSFLTGNTNVPKAGEPVFLNDGRYSFGDGVTQFQNLVFFNTTSLTDDKQTFLNADGNAVTVPHVPVFVSGVFAGPGYLSEGIDYTRSGSTFTFLSPSFVVGLTIAIIYKY